ncbi:MAG: hypothetical protein ACJ710_04375 [Ornithinibacter sp.]
MGAERWDEQVGSVADEAGRLLESLRRSAAESAAGGCAADDGSDADGPAPAAGSAPASGTAGSAAGAAEGMPGADSGPDASGHDPFCTWCPLCRGAAVVRSLSPETLAKLADLATLAATVLTDLASSRRGGGPPASDPDRPVTKHTAAPASPGHRSRRSGPAPSRPIPVSDADDPQEAPRG